MGRNACKSYANLGATLSGFPILFQSLTAAAAAAAAVAFAVAAAAVAIAFAFAAAAAGAVAAACFSCCCSSQHRAGSVDKDDVNCDGSGSEDSDNAVEGCSGGQGNKQSILLISQ